MEIPGLRPVLVTDEAGVRAVCRRAADSGRVALDTESDSLHSYFHKLCLIQLSYDSEHAVLDPLALDGSALGPLRDLLADPGVEKVLHGADYDLRVLDRDLHARVVRLADTQVAAQLLGERQTGLAALVEREAGVTLDKRYQRADWGLRPLDAAMLAYAAGDTAYLGLVRDRLAARLEELGRSRWWAEECRALEAIAWEPPPPDPLAFERLKGAKRLKGDARARVAALHAWRERTAAAADVPPFKVLRGEALLALAQTPPADPAALAATAGVGRALARRFGAELLPLLAAPPPPPEPQPRQRVALDRTREARVREARDARDALARELAIEPGVLASRAALEQVVDRAPRGQEELEPCLGRRWRTELLAPVLLPLVAKWTGSPLADAQPA